MTELLLALTHAPSPRMNACIRTHAAHEAIDLPRAIRQHENYRAALASAGAEVVLLDVSPNHPDAVFIEDTAVVLDEIAILGSMGASARRPEPAAIEPELARHRSLARVTFPATLEGGDVVRVGKQLLVGLSSRTNAAGIAALESIVKPYGYAVVAVPVSKCLHLKTACTALPDGSLLVNEAWLDASAANALGRFERVPVPEDEPDGANVVLIGPDVVMSASHPATAERVARHARRVHSVDLSEFAKADGSATCLSLVLSSSSRV